MLFRLARLIACTLLMCVTAEPLPFLGLSVGGAMSESCCKQVCCCRRSHTDHGPTLTSAMPCASGCPIAVRNIKLLAAIEPPARIQTTAAPPVEPVAERRTAPAFSHRDVFLYQRPPPAES